MGDRANVVITQGSQQVCLYTHWSGTELPSTLRAALARGRDRWTDSQYLARIVFCEMVKGRDENETTGFGISQGLGDGRDKVITVDCDEETVQIDDRPAMPIHAFIESNVGWSA